MLEILKKLIAIPSVYPDELACSGYVFDLLSAKPYLKLSKFYIAENRYNLLVEYRNSASPQHILLYAHLDTVPASDDWKTDPFSPELEGDLLVGLGSYDMKGGAAMIIDILLNHNNLPIKVIFGVDEENISAGMHALAGHAFLDNIDVALVPEPNFNRGVDAICLGRRGRVVIEASFEGDTNHIFLAEQSANAIIEMATFNTSLAAINLEENVNFGKTFLVPTAASAQAKGMSIPGSASCTYDVMLVPPETSISILNKLNSHANMLMESGKIKYLPKFNLKTRATPFLEAFEIPADHPLLPLITSAIERNELKPKYYYRDSVGDENVLAHIHGIMPFTIGPDGQNAHRGGEGISISSLHKLSQIYLGIITNFKQLP